MRLGERTAKLSPSELIRYSVTCMNDMRVNDMCE